MLLNMDSESSEERREQQCSVEESDNQHLEASIGIYSELPEGAFIRYLILEPGTTEPISCRLITVALEETPPFEAISYVWGSNERNQPITCNRATLGITANLRDTLYQVRLEDQTRALWADSICINQEDAQERGKQVALMEHIYSKAKRVLICIGLPGKEQSSLHAKSAQALVSDVNHMIDSELAKIDMDNDNYSNTFPYPEPGDAILSDTRWESLAVLHSQPWFTRGWVVQEAGLASVAVVLWGSVQIDWVSLVRVQLWLLRRASKIRDTHPTLGISDLHVDIFERQNSCEARCFYPDHTSTLLGTIDTLNQARELSLTDPRDRLHALLPLINATDRTQLALEPDYTRHYLDDYLDFATRWLSMGRDSFELLHSVVHTESTLSDQFPSWVPRWNTDYHPVGCSHPASPQLLPRITKEFSPSINLSIPDRILEVRGVIFDRVQFHTDTLSSHLSIDDPTITSFWNIASDMTTKSPYSPSSRPIALATAITLRRVLGDWTAWIAHREAYISRLGALRPPSDPAAARGTAENFHAVSRQCVDKRRIILTERGYFGLAPRTVMLGDLCCILFGGRSSFILRRRTHRERECY